MYPPFFGWRDVLQKQQFSKFLEERESVKQRLDKNTEELQYLKEQLERFKSRKH
jgi:hypothetical protein